MRWGRWSELWHCICAVLERIVRDTAACEGSVPCRSRARVLVLDLRRWGCGGCGRGGVGDRHVDGGG